MNRELESHAVPTLAPTSAEMDLADAGAVEALDNLLRPSDALDMLPTITPVNESDNITFMKNLTMMQNL